MAGFDAIGAIGSQSHKIEDKKDMDNAGGMFMASAPVSQHPSVFSDGVSNLTEKQKTGSIFA